MRKWGFSAMFMLAPVVAILVTAQAAGFGQHIVQPTPLTAPQLGSKASAESADVEPAEVPRQAVALTTAKDGAASVARQPAGASGRNALRAAEAGISSWQLASSGGPPATPTIPANLAPAEILVPAPPTFLPLAIPERIYAPTIRLDTSITPVGWKEVRDREGKSRLEWIVASYQAGWHKNSAVPEQGGNIVLAAHNNMEGEIFRHIELLKPDDPIFLYAGGRIFKYRVTEKFAVLEKGASEAQRGDNAKWIGEFPEERLTLISCWPYSGDTHRMLVIAKPW
jgi:sortase A